MLEVYPSELKKPSGIVNGLPNALVRPSLEKLYGFDVPQEEEEEDGVFASSLTFPTIQVFDNESDFIDQTDAPNYTIVHAKDTDSLYVWDGSTWWIYDNT